MPALIADRALWIADIGLFHHKCTRARNTQMHKHTEWWRILFQMRFYTLSLSLSLSLSHTHAHINIHPHTHNHSLARSLSVSYACISTHPCTHAHTRTHIRTHTHTHTHTHTYRMSDVVISNVILCVPSC